MRQVVRLSALCIARFYAFGLFFFVESQVIVVRHDISLTHFLRKVRAVVRFSNQKVAWGLVFDHFLAPNAVGVGGGAKYTSASPPPPLTTALNIFQPRYCAL